MVRSLMSPYADFVTIGRQKMKKFELLLSKRVFKFSISQHSIFSNWVQLIKKNRQLQIFPEIQSLETW